jgi:hypothetical protein
MTYSDIYTPSLDDSKNAYSYYMTNRKPDLVSLQASIREDIQDFFGRTWNGSKVTGITTKCMLDFLKKEDIEQDSGKPTSLYNLLYPAKVDSVLDRILGKTAAKVEHVTLSDVDRDLENLFQTSSAGCASAIEAYYKTTP